MMTLSLVRKEYQYQVTSDGEETVAEVLEGLPELGKLTSAVRIRRDYASIRFPKENLIPIMNLLLKAGFSVGEVQRYDE